MPSRRGDFRVEPERDKDGNMIEPQPGEPNIKPEVARIAQEEFMQDLGDRHED